MQHSQTEEKRDTSVQEQCEMLCDKGDQITVNAMPPLINDDIDNNGYQ